MTIRTNQWLKDAFMERDPDDYNRDLVDSFGNWRYGQGLGSVFYVNLGGDDDNPGTDPDDPLLTIAGALAKCTDDYMDTIFVLDYWNNDTVWPINIDVSRVRIVGSAGSGAQWPTIVPTGDFAAFMVNQAYVEIARMTVSGGANHGCIETGSGRWGLWLRNLWFGVTGTGQDGFRGVAPFDMPYLLITGCRFGQGLTRDGVRLDHNATRGSIGHWNGPGNLFDRVAGIGVNVVGNCSEIGVYNNKFLLAADTAGDAVTLSAGTNNCFVDGNVAHYGKAAMGQNPYRDLGGVTNTWGLNHSGILAVLPAVV